MSQTLSRLDRLLGTELAPLLTSVAGAGATVEDCLEWNQQAFSRWLKSHGFSTEDAVRSHFRNALDEAEKALGELHTWGSLTREADLKRAVAFLSAHRPPLTEGIYLKEDTALSVITKLPPAGLIEAAGVRTAEDLLYTLTALDAIALTRHTESAEWQDAYLEILGTLDARHFEGRAIRTLVASRELLERAATRSGRSLKPWPMSHNKETGTLTFYPLAPTQDLATPNLLLTMLFFHYYFETIRAARLVRGNQEDIPTQTGERLAFIIRSTRRAFPFASPNVHSEALHWEDALAYVSTVFPALAFREYTPLLPCGEFCTESAREPLSLNLIDHLWDANFNPGADYFDHGGQSFTYHFRETFWSEILQTLRRLSRSEMRSTVFRQLELDDETFTRWMLDREPQPLSND